MKTRLYSEGKTWFEKWYTRTYAVPSRNKEGFRLVRVRTIMQTEWAPRRWGLLETILRRKV